MEFKAMPDFKELVEADIRNSLTKKQQDVLHKDLHTWHDCLKALKRDVEAQFAARRAKLLKRYAMVSEGTLSDTEYNHEYADEDYRKVAALRFLQAIEARMSYVKSLKRDEHAAAVEAKVTPLNEKTATVTG